MASCSCTSSAAGQKGDGTHSVPLLPVPSERNGRRGEVLTTSTLDYFSTITTATATTFRRRLPLPLSPPASPPPAGGARQCRCLFDYRYSSVCTCTSVSGRITADAPRRRDGSVWRRAARELARSSWRRSGWEEPVD